MVQSTRASSSPLMRMTVMVMVPMKMAVVAAVMNDDDDSERRSENLLWAREPTAAGE